ncbi:MAG: DUF6599 family protein [candidate division KSB1 bacterium]|nr:DUF6599 family protein [candidate division KSB1 bacterium]
MRFLFLLLCVGTTVFAGDSDIVSFLPDADFSPGWSYDFEPEVYGPDNLFEYINGEAELYKDYEFNIMATASYMLDSNPALSFTVDVYDMGTALNAFGVYSSYRKPNLRFADIGTQATLSEMTIRFYKGKYFVQLNAGSLEDTVKTVMRETAAAIADKLPDLPLPEKLTWLPDTLRVEHSLTYVTRGFLGQGAFGQVLHAQYTLKGQTCSGFAALFESPDQAIYALNQFKQSLKQREIEVSDSGDRIAASLPYQGHVVMRPSGNRLIGAFKAKDRELADTVMQLIRNHL